MNNQNKTIEEKIKQAAIKKINTESKSREKLPA